MTEPNLADVSELSELVAERKRLLALEYLLGLGSYDAINTVCASSYVDQLALLDYTRSIKLELAFHGGVGVCEYTGCPYVSGNRRCCSHATS